MADTGRDNAIDPIVLRGRRLERWSDAEIIARRIDCFAFFDSCDDIGRAVAQALVGHAYQGIVLCLEDEPDIQCRGAVAASRLPIAAAVQYLACQAFALERASGDHADTA